MFKFKEKLKKSWRITRILVGSFFYLLATLVLLISLKCYPKDIRQDAKDSFC